MPLFRTVRACLAKPEFWVLTGTVLPPLNVLWAAGFVVAARLRARPGAPALSRCLNVQATYTLLLIAPLLCGSALQYWALTRRVFAPGSQSALVAGIALGVLGALGLLSLVFFNTRALAESLHGRECWRLPRLRLFPE